MTKYIGLGDVARDEVTGFVGMVVAETKWMNGCVRLSLQPQKLDKDGKPLDTQSFDIEQLVLVKATKKPEHKPAGGPMPSPARRRDPGRR